MLNCGEAIEMIAQEVDGVTDAEAFDRLNEHLAECAPCRCEAESQLLVRQVLAGRPADRLPERFAGRLAKRLDAEPQTGWLEFANWRIWCVRLLPAAAALFVVAVASVTKQAEPGATQPVRNQVLWVPQDSVDLFLRPDVSGDAQVMQLWWGSSLRPLAGDKP